MISYYGDFAEDSTIYIPFNTFSSDDPSASVTITNLADADIKVHKDGGLTQIATDGATVAIDYDGITGNHLITIDTSAHADYSTGSDYQVRIEGTTVDGATINAFVGVFSIENRYNAAADDLANVTDGLGALKTILDSILVDTGTTIPGTITTMQNDLDTITDSDGVILGAAGVDLIWDEVLTGATHNVNNSAGKRLRQVDAASEVHSGTAQAGSSTTITLDTGASATDDIYNGDRIVIIAGTGEQEHGLIIDYNGTTKVATMSKAWVITPDNTSEFVIAPADCDVETWNHNTVTGDGDWAALKSETASILTDTGTTLDTHLTDIKGATFSGSTDSLKAIRDRGDAAWVTGGGGSAPTASEVADAVWDEVLSGHLTAGTTGNALNAAGSAGDPWSTTLPGAYTGSQAGKLVGDNINAPIATVDTVVDAIKAVTDLLPDSGSLSSLATSSALATVDSNVDAVLVDTNELQTDWVNGGRLDLILDARASQSSVDTIDTNVDAILVDTGTTLPSTLSTLATSSALSTVDSVVDAIEIDTQNIQSRLPTSLTSGRMNTNVESIDGDTTAATYLAAHTRRAVPVTFSGGSTTTAVLVNVDGATASATDDVYNGRVFVFSAPSGLKDQACEITDYVGATKTATITAVTTAVSASSVAIMV